MHECHIAPSQTQFQGGLASPMAYPKQSQRYQRAYYAHINYLYVKLQERPVGQAQRTHLQDEEGWS